MWFPHSICLEILGWGEQGRWDETRRQWLWSWVVGSLCDSYLISLCVYLNISIIKSLKHTDRESGNRCFFLSGFREQTAVTPRSVSSDAQPSETGAALLTRAEVLFKDSCHLVAHTQHRGVQHGQELPEVCLLGHYLTRLCCAGSGTRTSDSAGSSLVPLPDWEKGRHTVWQNGPTSPHKKWPAKTNKRMCSMQWKACLEFCRWKKLRCENNSTFDKFVKTRSMERNHWRETGTLLPGRAIMATSCQDQSKVFILIPTADSALGFGWDCVYVSSHRSKK